MTDIDIEVTHAPERLRYEARVDGTVVGFAEYILATDLIVFTHTEVDPAFGGRGLARRLVTWELDDVRSRGLAALPFCPYVRKVIAENAEQYLDLVPAQDRERFDLPAAAEA